MEAIIKELGETLDNVRALRDQYQKQLNDLTDRDGIVSAREAGVKKMQDELIPREHAVAEIENVLQLKKDAENFMAKANERMNVVKEAEVSLHRQSELRRQELENLRAKTKQEVEDTLKRKANIEKEVAERVDAVLVNMGIKKG